MEAFDRIKDYKALKGLVDYSAKKYHNNHMSQIIFCCIVDSCKAFSKLRHTEEYKQFKSRANSGDPIELKTSKLRAIEESVGYPVSLLMSLSMDIGDFRLSYEDVISMLSMESKATGIHLKDLEKSFLPHIKLAIAYARNRTYISF